MNREKLLQNPLPIDRVSARVVKKAKPEEVWSPKPLPMAHYVESTTVLPIAPLPHSAPRELLSLSGKRRGRMTIVGYAATQGAKDTPAKWVVRCDCGNYEHRKRILRWLGTNDNDMCRECQNRAYLLRGGYKPPKDRAQRTTSEAA